MRFYILCSGRWHHDLECTQPVANVCDWSKTLSIERQGKTIMTTTPTTQTWRNLTDRLTPAQANHLAAVERLALANADNPAMRATAADIINGLSDEAVWYAQSNPEPGAVELSDIEQFRRLLATIPGDQLTGADVRAMLDVVGVAMAVPSSVNGGSKQ